MRVSIVILGRSTALSISVERASAARILGI
jgi:hypothetical protein